MGANFNPTIGSIKDMRPFKFWCQKVLPTVYDDSLSYYELLNKVVDYLNDNVDNINQLNDNVESIYQSYLQLQGYVNQYFDQNFPELVSNKLDEMAENGTLTELITAYIDPLFGQEVDRINGEFSILEGNVNDAIDEQDNTISEQNNAISLMRSQIDNFINTHAGLTGETVLWSGTLAYNGDSATLSDLPSEFEYIDVHWNVGNLTEVVRMPATSFDGSVVLSKGRTTDGEGGPYSTNGMAIVTMLLTVNNNVVTCVASTDPAGGASATHWDGEAADDAVISVSATPHHYGGIVTKIVGVSNVQNDAEIVDARVGFDSSQYPTLGSAVRGQASELINSLYHNKRFLQCGFMNGSRTNQNSGETIDATKPYRICSVNKFSFTETTTFVIGDGFKVRRYWFDLEGNFVSFDGSWHTESVDFSSQYQYYINVGRVEEDETEVADISTFMQQVYTLTPEANLEMFVKGYGVNITSTNVQSVCGGDANNLPSNVIYSVQADAITVNAPSRLSQGYTLVCLSRSATRTIATGTTQIAFYSHGHIFYRNYWNGAWSKWYHLYNTNSTRILAFGDSICLGGRNNNKGFAGGLGIPYKNDAVDGGLLSKARDNAHWIENAIVAEADTDFDTVILEGGINDYIYDAPLGTLSSHPVRYEDDEYALLDTNTVLGALEHAFGLIIHKFTNSSKYFLITHKTRNYPWTKNFNGGFTQQELHDAIVQCCKLYNIMIIDVYEKSNVNTFFPEYYSPTPWVSDNSVGDLYFVDNDRVHPLSFGYEHAYKPIILEALKLNQ